MKRKDKIIINLAGKFDNYDYFGNHFNDQDVNDYYLKYIMKNVDKSSLRKLSTDVLPLLTEENRKTLLSDDYIVTNFSSVNEFVSKILDFSIIHDFDEEEQRNIIGIVIKKAPLDLLIFSYKNLASKTSFHKPFSIIDLIKQEIIERCIPSKNDASMAALLVELQATYQVVIVPYKEIEKGMLQSEDGKSLTSLLKYKTEDSKNAFDHQKIINRLFKIRDIHDEKLRSLSIPVQDSNRYVYYECLFSEKPELVVDFNMETICNELRKLNSRPDEIRLLELLSKQIYYMYLERDKEKDSQDNSAKEDTAHNGSFEESFDRVPSEEYKKMYYETHKLPEPTVSNNYTDQDTKEGILKAYGITSK